MSLLFSSAKDLLTERFRCGPDLPDFRVGAQLSQRSGYFCVRPKTICYGRCSSVAPAARVENGPPDLSNDVTISGSSVYLPFDAAEVVDNLRYERYHLRGNHAAEPSEIGLLRSMYYSMRPLLGTSTRVQLQRFYFRHWREIAFPTWPVDRTVEEIFERLLFFSMKSKQVERLPFIWFWPDGAPSCTVMTHDVETSTGLEFCPELMDLDDSFGIKSSFQIVPEKRYSVSATVLETIRKRGFEINVHDLNHDGLLWSHRGEFLRRAEKINSYGIRFKAKGFRSAIMYRNADWFSALNFAYDMSIPNVAHLEPQRGGCCTVLPFFIGDILELPLTTTQDYSLFAILRDYSTRLWMKQVSLIQEQFGLISFITHPDYLIEKKARAVYQDLLSHLSAMRANKQTWIARPGEVAEWWRSRSKMSLAKEGGSWQIHGQGSERATIAFAVLNGDHLNYEFDQPSAVADVAKAAIVQDESGLGIRL